MKHISISILILIFNVMATFAQDGRTDLLDTLNAVPDQTEYRETLVSYADYRAIVEARQGAEIPTSFEEFTARATLESELYWAAFQGIYSGPDFLRNLLSGGDLWGEVVGFDFLALERGITFGIPPAFGNVYVGDFDVEAVTEAFSERDYMAESLGDFTLFCSADGCDEGTRVNIENRNPSNPFGGDLGRAEPVAVSDTMIINSPAISVVILAEDAATDKLNSLADNANYATAVNSINPDHLVVQAMFVHPSQISMDTSRIKPGDESDALEELMAQLSDLPQYNLVMLADTATDTEQVVYVSLVYRSLDDAETAIGVVPARLETIESLRFQRPIADIFTDRNITDIIATATQNESTNLAIATFEFHAPLPSNEPFDDFPKFVTSSMVYRLFVEMVYSRDLGWLATG